MVSLNFFSTGEKCKKKSVLAALGGCAYSRTVPTQVRKSHLKERKSPVGRANTMRKRGILKKKQNPPYKGAVSLLREGGGGAKSTNGTADIPGEH